MITRHARAWLLAGIAACFTLPAIAQTHDHRAHKREYFQPGTTLSGLPGDDAPVPFHQGLAGAPFPVTTASAKAQAYFNQGMALFWGFNHAEAIRAFRAAQTLDPTCAMCFWGEALALGPNINDSMAREAVQPAWAAITRAQSLADKATAREQALIEALSARYGSNAMAARQRLDRAWAEAIRGVAARWPGDPEVLTLHAEALMNLQPWDYWAPDGETLKGAGAEIVATLERALRIAPDHIGALHLYIHAVEASADPARGEAAADRLRQLAPATGHLLHMPAHIYSRIGRHGDSIAVNRAAIAADEAYLAEVGPSASQLWRYGYVPHNVHYMLVSAQMAGLGEEVLEAAGRLAAITSDDVSERLAWVQAIRTAPYSGHALFSDPATILELPDPGTRFPFIAGFWHYARGLAWVRTGDLATAEAEARAIDRLIETADLTALEAQYLPASEILAIARDMVRARVAWARGEHGEAERLVRAAIEREGGIGYMEPPYWYYPLHQTLGAILLDQGKAEEARQAFGVALARVPRNGWALWGLWQATAATNVDQPDNAEAAAARDSFRRAWLGDPAILSLDRL